MAKVNVYKFWHYDIVEDRSILTPSRRTEAKIREMGFEPAFDTAEEVEEAELDEFGRYHPNVASGSGGET